jgi:hypothetical protein
MFRKRRHEHAEGGSTPPPVLHCSFCSKSQRDVKKLIAGPNVNICDECVDICNDIIADDRVLVPAQSLEPKLPSAVEGVVLDSPPTSVRPVRCKLCGSIDAVEFCLPITGRGWLCGSCLDAVREVLDASRPET